MNNEKLDLKLIIGSDNNGETIVLSGVPTELWNSFVRRCAGKLKSDKPETAWSQVIAGVIQSEFLTKEVIIPYLETQKSGEYTFLLAGIPLEARDKMDMYTSQANLTPDLLVALMYNAAMSGDLHILNLKPPEEHTGYHVLVNTGITDEVWAAWSKLAENIADAAGQPVSPEELMGHLLERVLWGDVTVTDKNPDDPTNGKVEHPEVNDLETDVSDMKRQLDQLMERMESNAKSQD